MKDNQEARIATADALTLLLHNQHALAAGLEEVAKWLSEHEEGDTANNVKAALETLDKNAKQITSAILGLR